MALMNWAIDVPQKLLQSDARLFSLNELNIYFISKVNIFIFIFNKIYNRKIYNSFIFILFFILFIK